MRAQPPGGASAAAACSISAISVSEYTVEACGGGWGRAARRWDVGGVVEGGKVTQEPRTGVSRPGSIAGIGHDVDVAQSR